MSEVDWDWDPHEGLDCRTKDPHCANCCKEHANNCFHRGPFKPVKQCQGCKLVYYCSRDCQIAHRAAHKRPCKTIKKQRELVDDEEEKARAMGFFETHDGDFWEMAFPYIKARCDLALLIHPAAFQSNILDNWKEMNSHLQEVLRLTHKFDGNDFRVGTKFAMFLLHEGRDDDACAYVRFYLQSRWSDGPIDPSLKKLHEGTSEGDWIYPKETNCHCNDIFDDCPNLREGFSEEAYLFSILWLIKKRLLCTHVGREKAFHAFVSTDAGQQLFDQNHDVGYVVLSFLIGFEAEKREEHAQWIQSQDEQLNELSRRMDAINPLILPAFADTSRSILRSGLPAGEELLHGRGQVFYILNDCNKHLDTLPGLEDWIAQWLQRRG